MDAIPPNDPPAKGTPKNSSTNSSSQESKVDLDLLRAGDEKLFRELLAAAEPSLISLIARWTEENPAHAEDLLQETRIRIYRKRASYSGRGSFTRWATTLCLNLCRAHQRLQERDPTVPVDEPDDFAATDPDPEEELRSRQRVAVVEEALGRLDQRQRQAVVARYCEGRSTAEVARGMRVTEKVARTLLDKALRNLRGMDAVMELMLDPG